MGNDKRIVLLQYAPVFEQFTLGEMTMTIYVFETDIFTLNVG